jgi:hypothetical protein
MDSIESSLRSKRSAALKAKKRIYSDSNDESSNEISNLLSTKNETTQDLPEHDSNSNDFDNSKDEIVVQLERKKSKFFNISKWFLRV